jgi:hypothetical protein
MSRPSDTEYASYYARYVSLVPDVDILKSLEAQLVEAGRIVAAVSSERERFRYGEGKWSIREVYGHIIDAERVFAYRAFCFSRGESASLPSFDEKAYVAHSRYDERTLRNLHEEFTVLRKANLAFLRWCSEASWLQQGVASNNQVSVRALAFIMVGHARHHFNVLRDRYGVVPGP